MDVSALKKAVRPLAETALPFHEAQKVEALGELVISLIDRLEHLEAQMAELNERQ